MRIDPQIAYTIDRSTLQRLVAHADVNVHTDLQRAFATYLARASDGDTWQDAWNTWTGATEQRPGTIRLYGVRCPDCQGRGFSTTNIAHNLGRTGNALACGTCRGRRTTDVTLVARPARA